MALSQHAACGRRYGFGMVRVGTCGPPMAAVLAALGSSEADDSSGGGGERRRPLKMAAEALEASGGTWRCVRALWASFGGSEK